MKTVINILLIAAIAVLAYLCVQSVSAPIEFERVKNEREKAIIQRLIDIRTISVEFKDQNGYFTQSFDTLVNFVKTGKKRMILKEGTLNDYQLDQGLTEAKAAAIVRKGNQAEIIANGLQNFRRDTAFVTLFEALFPNKTLKPEAFDDLAIIPFSENAQFELKVRNDYWTGQNIRIPLFEVTAPYQSYLSDLNRQELLNVIDVQEKLNKYPGLKVGSIEEPNNNAGNWE